MSYTLHIITTNGAQIITNGMVESVVNEWNGENEIHFSFQHNEEHQERKKKNYIYIFDENSRDGKFLNYKFMKHKPF
jgi:hypothetical protein